MDIPILILLAGGKSSRMGSPKGLLDYQGTPWILEQVKRYGHIENPKVYIGLGYDFQKYFDSIPWLKNAIDNFYNYNGVEVKVVMNNQPEYGAFSTLQTVLREIEEHSTVMIQPIDVPLANIESLTAIINENNSIVIASYKAKNGHPVKLKPVFWNTLLMVNTSSNTARLDTQIKQVKTSSITYVSIADNAVYQNINTLKKWNDYLTSIK